MILVSPEPSPGISDELGRLEVIGLEIVAAMALGAVLAGVIAFSLLRAASKDQAGMVTIAVSILTMVAIVGFVATSQEALVTLAGAGMGALAGAVTNLFGKPDDGESSGDVSGPDTLGPPDSEVS